MRNKYKLDKNRFSALNELSTVKPSFNLKNNQTFGYPVFVLTTALQDHNILSC